MANRILQQNKVAQTKTNSTLPSINPDQKISSHKSVNAQSGSPAESHVITNSSVRPCLDNDDEDEYEGNRFGILGQLIFPTCKTNCGRKIQIAQVMLVAILAFAGIIVQVYTDSEQATRRIKDTAQIQEQFDLLGDLYDLITVLRAESTQFFSTVHDSYEQFLAEAQTQMKNTDNKLLFMSSWPSETDLLALPTDQRVNLTSPNTLALSLRNQRNLRKIQNATSEIDALSFYQTLADNLYAITGSMVLRMPRFSGWHLLQASNHLVETATQINRIYRIGRIYVIQKRQVLGDPLMGLFTRASARYDGVLSIVAIDSDFTRQVIESNYSQQDSVRAFMAAYSDILEMKYDKIPLADLDDAYQKTAASIGWLQNTVMDMATEYVNAEYVTWKTTDIASITLVITALVIAAVGLVVHYWNFSLLQVQLVDGHERADMLETVGNVLYDCLPSFMVRIVKAGNMLPAHRATDICIAVLDVDIAQVMGELQPSELLELMAKYFSTLETVLAKYSCYKVDVIGEACCIAAGVGEPRSIDQVVEVVFMALELKDRISEIKIHELKEDGLRVRVGIHVGQGICQILYLQVPRMCVFGEVVQVAALVHATSLPTRVQVTASVYDRMINCSDVVFYKRGNLNVPDCRDVSVYWAFWIDDTDETLVDSHSSIISTQEISHQSDDSSSISESDREEEHENEQHFTQ